MIFLDSNVWLYAFLPEEGDPKRERANELIQRPDTIASPNVINEVSRVLLRKGEMGEDDVQAVIREFYVRCSIITLDKEDFIGASNLRKRYGFSFWDSFHVSAALKADASELFSEDMQDRLMVESRVRIVNPFKGL